MKNSYKITILLITFIFLLMPVTYASDFNFSDLLNGLKQNGFEVEVPIPIIDNFLFDSQVNSNVTLFPSPSSQKLMDANQQLSKICWDVKHESEYGFKDQMPNQISFVNHNFNFRIQHLLNRSLKDNITGP